MIIRQVFPLKDIVEIQEELKRLYGDNFIVVEINHFKKRIIPFIPFLGKDYSEVIIEIPESTENNRNKSQSEENFGDELIKEIFLKEFEELRKEIKTLKEELRISKTPKKMQITVNSLTLDPEDRKFLEQLGNEALTLLDLLMEEGFSEKFSVEILRECTGYDIENQLFDLKDNSLKALTEAFTKIFKFSTLENFKNQKVVILVGPTGVGKTTTIAKIVSNFVIDKQKTVGVISLDTFRVGGTQRLESFLKVLEIPFRKADTKKAFDTALEDFSDKDYIFVDIAGRSIYDELSWKEIFNILSNIEEDKLLPLFTVSFNMSKEVVLEIYNQLKSYPLKGVVLTKADETIRRGIVLDAVREIDLPLYYITNGQKVPHNILAATPQNLAKIVLNEE